MNLNADYHKPKHVKLKDATNVVIFIHGIVEGPGQFLRLMEVTYNSGYSAASLLLPGHGGSGRDFAQSSGKKWIKHVSTQVAHFKKEYKKIILVGHSMGTLLSIITFVDDPKQIIGIVAIDSPLHVWVTKRAIINNLKIGFSRKISENDPAYALLQASSVAPCFILAYLLWIHTIIDLFRLIHKTRKCLHHISIPILVFHADKDELVSSSSIKVFKQKVSPKHLQVIRLPESTHFIYKGIDWKTLQNAYCQFLSRCFLDEE